MTAAGGRASLMRTRSGEQRVTNAELFFDLVFVFAVTQLSHLLITHPTVTFAVRAAVLLALVWLAWAYTMWVTNWLDPDRLGVRAMLFAVAVASLVLSAGLPHAFSGWQWAVAGAYSVIQVGRTLFFVAVLRREGPDRAALARNFERVLAWCLVSAGLALLGAAVGDHLRTLCWLGAVAVDLAGGAVGFYTPGLGRSRTTEWDIDGGHMAERCQAFVLIALGESVVVTGDALSQAPVAPSRVVAFLAAALGVIALWWVYFDRAAGDAADVIARSSDPGRLGRSAYHFVHPIIVAGIIVTAAADQLVIDHPTGDATRPTAWMVLGGCALFLLGHALFKSIVWRIVSWPRLFAGIVLVAIAPFGTRMPALVLAVICFAAIIAVIAADKVLHPVV